MEKLRAFLKRKDIVFSAKRYFIDAMGAMAQGLFCTLLVGTILNTLGQQFHIGFLNAVIVTLGKGDGAVSYTIGGLCSAMVGPGMAVAIARALNAPPLVLFSLIPVGFATNYMGDAGGPLAVLFVAIVAAELGKAVSKETKIDILVTPIVTRQQVQSAETNTLVDRMFGGSFASLFANFLNSDQLSEKTLDELQALIDEKRNKD